jgi:hypothetical protein
LLMFMTLVIMLKSNVFLCPNAICPNGGFLVRPFSYFESGALLEVWHGY